jgi:hypothetical protein
MSITDILAGRMAPAQPFGQRRAVPMPARPQPARRPSPFLHACRAYLLELRAAGPALWQRAAFSVAYLQAMIELHRPALPQLPGLPQLGRRILAFPATLAGLLWQGLKSLARPRQPRKTRSAKAVIRAALRSDVSTTLTRLIAYLGGLAMLAIMALHMSRAIPSPVRGEPEPQPEWVQVAKPFPAFSIAMPETTDSGQDYILQRHKAGGGRRDMLTWGELKGAAPHLMVEIYRPLSEPASFNSPEREIAARLADAGRKCSPHGRRNGNQIRPRVAR